MPELAARYNTWEVLRTTLPLIAGGVGAFLVWHKQGLLGRTVLVYALLCLFVAFSPFWFPKPVEVPGVVLQPLLLETKFAFVVGLAAVLAAGGRTARG